MRLPKTPEGVSRGLEDTKSLAAERRGIAPQACSPWYPDGTLLGICRRECCRFQGFRTRCRTEYKVCGS